MGADFEGPLAGLLLPTDRTYNLVVGWEDGGPTIPVALIRDTTPPVFTVAVASPPSYGGDDAGFFVMDPTESRSGVLPLIKKDETVTVEVRSTSSDVAPGTVRLTLRAGGATWDAGQPSSCGTNPFCQSYTLALGPQSMAEFAQEVVGDVAGSDGLNSSTLADAGVMRVTRWKWARAVTTNEIKAPPVVSQSGDLFLGSRGTGGGVFKVTPTGGATMESNSGPVEAGLAIGRNVSGDEAIYFMTTNGGIQTLDGGASVCSGGGSSLGNVGSLAILNDATNQAMGVGVVGGNSDLTGRQLRGLVGGATCLASSAEAGGASPMGYPGNVVTNGNDVWYAASDGTVKHYLLTGTALVPQTTVGGLGAGTLYGIALFNSGLTLAGGGGGAGIGRLFVKASDNSGTPTGYDMTAHVTGVAVGSGNALFAVTQSSELGTLRRFDATGNATLAAALPGGLTFAFPSGSVPGATTPLLGNGGWVFATANDGLVVAADQGTLSVKWTKVLPPAIGGQVFASPTLDCNRTKPGSSTGMHYLATTSGWVVAYITEAPGLDVTAPWPKYQHDVRNTGRVGTSVACP